MHTYILIYIYSQAVGGIIQAMKEGSTFIVTMKVNLVGTIIK